jgi:hypothetical protein
VATCSVVTSAHNVACRTLLFARGCFLGTHKKQTTTVSGSCRRFSTPSGLHIRARYWIFKIPKNNLYRFAAANSSFFVAIALEIIGKNIKRNLICYFKGWLFYIRYPLLTLPADNRGLYI